MLGKAIPKTTTSQSASRSKGTVLQKERWFGWPTGRQSLLRGARFPRCSRPRYPWTEATERSSILVRGRRFPNRKPNYYRKNETAFGQVDFTRGLERDPVAMVERSLKPYIRHFPQIYFKFQEDKARTHPNCEIIHWLGAQWMDVLHCCLFARFKPNRKPLGNHLFSRLMTSTARWKWNWSSFSMEIKWEK